MTISEDEFKARMAARDARKAKGKIDAEAYDREVMIALDDAEQAHGDDRVRRVVINPLLSVIITIPGDGEMRQWRTLQRSNRATPAAQVAAADAMARSAVVWPSADRYAELAREFPGLHESVAAEAAKLAGVIDMEDAKK